MDIVKNITGSGKFPLKTPMPFKDDDGKSQTVEAGEEIECNYKRSMDERLVTIPKSKKKKEVKSDGSNSGKRK